MDTWLDQIKRECEIRPTANTHLAELKQKVTAHRRGRSEAHRRQMAYIESFVPVEQQIRQWRNGLTQAVRHRPFSTMELVGQLRGRYKQRPAASAVATALRQLGFVQYRDWSKNGQGCRLWKVVDQRGT
ncbi:MAG TPA: hypothetical protein DHV98_03650 [Flavobacteriaceae bacterium]|nr:hypothetical protein [Flavobacteriaceae bacterium]